MISRIFLRVQRLLGLIAAIMLVILALIILGDIVGRNIFNSPLPGIPELIAAAVVAVSFIQLPECITDRGLVKTEILDSVVPRWFSQAVERTGDLLGGCLFMLIAYGIWDPLVRSVKTGEYTGTSSTLMIPTFPVYLVILLISSFVAVLFFHRLIKPVPSQDR